MTLRSEDDFLRLIDRHFPETPDRLLVGRGDDCCVIPRGTDLCVSTDLFLENVHFRRSYFTPEEIGHKALAVNVSDVAGMGGRPLGFTLELMIPDEVTGEFWERFFSGMSILAREHHLALAGGDLSRAPFLGVGLTIWGEYGPAGRFLPRGKARPGDLFFVVGEIGLARAGLQLLERNGRGARRQWPRCVDAHLHPLPRVAEGLVLAGLESVHGCMDISDGLARDLPRFLELSEANGLDVQSADLRPDGELVRFARQQGEDAALAALLGGEDYGLLGVCSPEGREEVLRAVPGARILGTATEDRGLRLDGKEIRLAGFDHFTA